MKKNVLLNGLLAVLMVFSLNVNGQDEEESDFSVGADVVSRYVWRGIQLGGPSPHIQPYAEYAFGESGLALGVWGSYSLGADGVGTEADLYLTYAPVEALSITVTDYFFPSGGFGAGNSYFNYNSDYSKGEVGGHTLEAMISYSLEKVYFTFAMNFWGFDGVNIEGTSASAQLAKYLEIGYAVTDEFSIVVGGQLDDPDEEEGDVGFYGDAMGITNIGFNFTKDIEVSDKLTVPVSTSFIVNPMQEELFMVFGFSF